MARQRSSVQMRKRRVRSLQAPIVDRVLDSIEVERGNLLKVESVLSCLTSSMEHDDASPSGTHYPDVAQVACDLLRQSIDRLDSLTLGRVLNRRGVKEEQDALRGILCLDLLPAASDRDLSYADLRP